MKVRTMILIVLAVICGGSAAVGVSQLAGQGQTRKADDVKIVIASGNISRGTVLSAETLTTRPWPSAALPPGALTDIARAAGRTTTVPLVKGEPLLEAKLASKDAGRGMAAMIPFGMRAFTIRTSHVAAGGGGFIMPGDKVDILLTMTDSMPDDKSGGGVTTTLLQNIEVLAVNQVLDAPETNKIDTKDLATATLLVSPDQAAKLDLGMNKGNLHLSLRNADDHRSGKANPATMAQLRYSQEGASKGGADWSAFTGLFRGLGNAPAKPEDPAPAAAAKPAEVPAPAQSTTSSIQTLRGNDRGVILVEQH
ncbi:MAG: Flp pilus assembly protein CpaB [Planctomycetia bacterium]|nr:Flp pilus assembly protein CpaB [Planctomycetia bacterium]